MDAVVAAWQDDPETADRIVHVECVAARTAITDPLDPPPPPSVTDRLAALGIDRLYRHQAAAIRSIRNGDHTVVVSGTASGKSLTYQIPIVEALAGGDDATALLLYPTKALARDQLRALNRVGTKEMVAAVYDGDTDPDDRRWIRRHANVVLTNPDMVHVGLLPHHARWGDFLHRLQFVVIDELHVLRGIFGSHVALVLRRLRRLAAGYGANPVFVFTSATIGNPAELASRLSGVPVTAIDQDTSPAGAKTFVLWNPELEDPARGTRASPVSAATRVFADLIRQDLHTIAFNRSRKASELMYMWAKDRLDPERAGRIAPYRAGYTAVDRRRTEEALFSGELLGVTATSALELGIDVGNLDAAVITTFPGTIASFRQQAGRAGRARDDSLAVLVAGQDALDQYYMHHPDDLFDRTPEAVVVNPDNVYVLRDHLACAAYESPLVPNDVAFFGEHFEETANDMVQAEDLRVRDRKLYWARRRTPAPGVNIRTSGDEIYTIGEEDGRLLGSIDGSRVFGQCHPGAVYLHQGETYVVTRLDLERREVTVQAARVEYYTQPETDKDLQVIRQIASGRAGRFGKHIGTVRVDSTVLGYQRKRLSGGRVLDTIPLDLPTRTLETEAFWFTVPDDVIADAGIAARDVPGTLHAAEHAAIAMLPLFAVCDRWDVGGLSTAMHPDTGDAVFFIYDGYPGGAGISSIGYDTAERHLRATLAAIAECPCRAGCPSCVQSPKCGNFNEPLDKEGAIALLREGLGDSPGSQTGPCRSVP
jgi:DEAD/DEAH box helicase domain-containing protein